MTVEIHAHKLLNLIRETPMSRTAVREKAIELYGEEALYCTCKLKDFDLNAILDFFVDQQKIVDVDGIWSINDIEVCSH